jgi:hypothetical protein
MERIQVLTRELSALSAADLPVWVAEGLREAIRRKCAEESPIVH